MPTVSALDKLDDVIARCEDFLASMVRRGFSPDERKTLRRLFSPAEAAVMVGKDRTTLARYEKELGIELARNPANGRRVGYTMEHIQAFRERFGTLPWRNPETDPPITIASQNFKGGAGKTTTCIHLAHYLALKGYRVLVIDADHQATTTSMFGYLPDRDLTDTDTILAYLSGHVNTLQQLIRTTHWPNIHLIPACLALSEAEIGIIVHLARQGPEGVREFLKELRNGIQEVAQNYDVILIDSPPSNGMIALSVLIAADALLVSAPPKMYDFASTVQFMKMIRGYIADIAPDHQIRWIHILCTLFNRQYKSHKEFKDLMKEKMGDVPFERVFMHNRDVMNGAIMFRTPFEEEKPPRESLQMIESVLEEVEIAIKQEWPSKQADLLQKGIA